MDFLRALLGPAKQLPHGFCLLWDTNLVWLHMVSDAVITLAYYVIPFGLVYFARKRQYLAFHRIFLLFGIFIFACGTTHAMAIWTVWHPDYGLEGLVKAVTAVLSAATAVLLVRMLPQVLELPKGTVGHHVKVLEHAGLIRVVRTRQVRAVTEKFYGRTARLFLFEVENNEDARAIGAAALRQASYELELASERASWGFVRSRLTSADAKRFERRLKRLIEDFRAAESPEGAAYALASGFWPAEPSDA